MFISNRKEQRTFPIRHRNGKIFYRKAKPILFLIFKCDTCGKTFERQSGRTRKNLNNHFCSSCYDPSTINKLGRAKRFQGYESRIGNKWIDSCGYINVYIGPKNSNKRQYTGERDYCGSIREHVFIMEEYLERSLKKGEVVHHIDGNKTNNNLDNLQVMSVADHNNCHGKSKEVIFDLYKQGIVGYNRETKKYYIVSCGSCGSSVSF